MFLALPRLVSGSLKPGDAVARKLRGDGTRLGGRVTGVSADVNRDKLFSVVEARREPGERGSG